MKVLITGASGFIGRALIKKILELPSIDVVAFSRSSLSLAHPKLKKIQGDLFNFEEIERALTGIEVAVYLVHSMLPTAGLDQGSFSDYDCILADNFQRACKKQGIKKIIYLSGLQPNSQGSSLHLNSRLEVEKILTESLIPTCILRAGMVLGDHGSSFNLLLRLIKRLPILICPRWTANLTQPVDVDDLIDFMMQKLTDLSSKSEVIDLGFEKSLTYLEMLKETAQVLGLKRIFIQVPFLSPKISSLWVRLITQTPKELVNPLIESLSYSMVVSPDNANWLKGDFKTSLKKKLTQEIKNEVKAFLPATKRENKNVRSVQRMDKPLSFDAQKIAREYFLWLPIFFSKILQVKIDQDECRFVIPVLNLNLLILKYVHLNETTHFARLRVEGGILSGKGQEGWLEFREIFRGEMVIAALHNFTPALPWFIYRLTQAPFHLFVMRAFGKHLKHLKENYE
jgi:uncharacterized protein YbjT (DUF2867 family)